METPITVPNNVKRWLELSRTKKERRNIINKMMRCTDVPSKIYLRSEQDVIRQLCSIGSKTYMSSHKSPYGDAAKVKTLTEPEYQQMWANFHQMNTDLIQHPEAINAPKREKSLLKARFVEESERMDSSPPSEVNRKRKKDKKLFTHSETAGNTSINYLEVGFSKS